MMWPNQFKSYFSLQMAKKGALWHFCKLVIGLLTVGWVALLYMPVAKLTEDRSYNLMTPLDKIVPFVPWTWWIYFPGYLLGLLVAIVAIRDNRIFLRSVAAIMLAQVFNSIIYMIIPSTFPRPEEWQGTGITAQAIHWFWSMDPPNNTFPSSHVAMASIAAIALWRDHSRWRLVPTATALGIIITVHTAKQHYWVDTLAGVAMAFFSSYLVFTLWPRLMARWIPAVKMRKSG